MADETLWHVGQRVNGGEVTFVPPEASARHRCPTPDGAPLGLRWRCACGSEQIRSFFGWVPWSPIDWVPTEPPAAESPPPPGVAMRSLGDAVAGVVSAFADGIRRAAHGEDGAR
jgi:hypothetical protein